MNKPNIRIFSDASFCPKTKSTGWCSLIKNNDWDQVDVSYGFFNTPIQNIQEAEFLSMTSGFLRAYRNKTIQTHQTIQFELDNKWVLGILLTFIDNTINFFDKYHSSKHSRIKKLKRIEKNNLSNTILKCLSIIEKIKNKFELFFMVSHVKAHKHKKFKMERNYYNKYCDNLAKKQMRYKRSIDYNL